MGSLKSKNGMGKEIPTKPWFDFILVSRFFVAHFEVDFWFTVLLFLVLFNFSLNYCV